MTRFVIISAIVALAFSEPARGDDAKRRYVAQQGEDRGDCTLPVRPCRTIAYALSLARKGDQIRVASGVYEGGTLEELLLVADGGIDVRGGFDRFDHFLNHAPRANHTTLRGVPMALGDRLRARGFHVIVDRKGLDDRDQTALVVHQATRTSRSAAACVDNSADIYPCQGVDLLAQLAPADLSSRPALATDIWGFVDLNTEREYALMGVTNGLAVIDVTDPTRPFEVDTVAGFPSLWRDVKVTQRYDRQAGRWRSHAYVSTDARGRLAVIDLTGLPNRVRLGRRSDAAAHNVYVSNVDYATGVPLGGVGEPPLLQVLGSVGNRGGVRSLSVDDPINLRTVAVSPQGYSHDASSMVVADDRAGACAGSGRRCEVLFDFNEDAVLLMDFSDPSAPRLLSSTTYDTASYVHSGWPTEDGRFLFVHDEFDERRFGLNTTVYVYDLADLTNPVRRGTWTGPTAAVDHNGYVRGNRYFMSTYTRGLTILDISTPAEPVEIGFFDTYPVSDHARFNGSWGVYPFLPSGILLVSDFNGGVFVLADRTPVPPQGRIVFAQTTVGGVEGDRAVLSVVRDGGAAGAVSVDYKFLAGSANAYDFVADAGTLEWPAGAQGPDNERRISIPLVRDRKTEPIERFFVRLENPVGGAVLHGGGVANVFIGDAGVTPTLGFAETRIAVDESAGRVVVTVQRRGSPVGEASVSYAVHSLTAVEDADFVPSTGELNWQDGDAAARTIVIPLVVDDATEDAEQFEVRLSSPSGAVLADSTVVVDVNAEVMAATGIYLFDQVIGQDLLEIRDGATLAPGEFAERPPYRVEIRGGDAVRSVGFAFDGATEEVANGSPFVFRPDSSYAEGDYEIHATPYPLEELGGDPGRSLEVSFTIRTPTPPVSDDASLQHLSLTGAAIRFDPEEASYAAVVPTVIESLTVRATPAAGAAAVISPEDANPHRSGHQVGLDDGGNTILITVTAENGTTTRVYDVFVFRGWFNWESR